MPNFAIKNKIIQASFFAVNSLLPPLCVLCGTRMADVDQKDFVYKGSLCSSCWLTFPSVASSRCHICDFIMPQEETLATTCLSCLDSRPKLDFYRHVWAYNKSARGLILKYKNSPSAALTTFIARMMLMRIKEQIEDYDLLMPIPLHFIRYLTRGYNQSTLLAHELALISGVPMVSFALMRHRYTKSLGKFNATERSKILKNSFRVLRPQSIKGRSIILVDDVLTTGATMNECAKVLIKGGAKKVSAITASRVNLPLAKK